MKMRDKAGKAELLELHNKMITFTPLEAHTRARILIDQCVSQEHFQKLKRDVKIDFNALNKAIEPCSTKNEVQAQIVSITDFMNRQFKLFSHKTDCDKSIAEL